MNTMNIEFGMDAVSGNMDVAGKKSFSQSQERSKVDDFKGLSRKVLLESIAGKNTSIKEEVPLNTTVVNSGNQSIQNVQAALESGLKKILGKNVEIKEISTSIPDAKPSVKTEMGERRYVQDTYQSVHFFSYSLQLEYNSMHLLTKGMFAQESSSRLFTLKLLMAHSEYDRFKSYHDSYSIFPFSHHCCCELSRFDEIRIEFSLLHANRLGRAHEGSGILVFDKTDQVSEECYNQHSGKSAVAYDGNPKIAENNRFMSPVEQLWGGMGK